MTLARRLAALVCAALLMAGLFPQASLAHGPEQHEDSAPAVEAPDARSIEAPTSSHGAAPPEAEPPAVAHRSTSVWKNLHPATVHFPIALFLVAGLVEALTLRGGGARKQAAVDVMVVAGAVGAAISVASGFIHTGWWFGGDAVMQWHRWIGVGIAVVGAIAAALVLRGGGRGLLRLCLAHLVAGVAVQGFLGGELAHGPAHLGF